MSKKQLSAAQGVEVACILFTLNTDPEGMVRLAHSALLPPAYLEGPGAIRFCAEWRAFTHAVITAGLMQHAPNSVLMAYLRQTGNLLSRTSAPLNEECGQAAEHQETIAPEELESFVDGPFAGYMPLLARGQQARCPDLFCQRLASETARAKGEASPPDDQSKARLAATMAMLVSAVWDKLENYEFLAD